MLPLALTACGDGGGSDGNTPPPPSTALTLTGTAATGSAIAGASIVVKCATGSGSGTSGTDGTFSISVDGGALPCALEMRPASGANLHSVATGSGSTAKANLTPLTELVVARLAGGDPGVWFAGFDASAASVATVAAITAAEASVTATLKRAGIDLSALGDLISVTLKASTSTATGDAYDQALDQFAAALAAGGTTLATFTTAITTAAAGTSTTASLPPELLLQPAAANCSALRSASYRIITPRPGESLAAQFGRMTINGGTLAVVRADASTGTLVANGACRFTDTSGTYNADLVVSPAGFLVGRYTTDGTTFRVMFGFPEQTHIVAELAGTWNVMSMTPTGSTHAPASGSIALSTAGQMNSAVNCENDATWAIDTCANVPDSVTGLIGPWVPDSDGGFDAPDAGSATVNTRTFAYVSGSGSMVIATVSATGFGLWSQPASIALPTVGASTASWNLDLSADFSLGGATYESTNVVDSVDTTAQSWTRTHGTVGQALTRVETVFANDPRTGFTHRAAGTVIASDGTTTSVIREFSMLRLNGIGLSVGVLPELKVFEFSPSAP